MEKAVADPMVSFGSYRFDPEKARLWQQQGKKDEARHMLTEICD